MVEPTSDLVSRLRSYGDAAPGTLADAEPFSMALEAAECLEAAVPFLRARAASCEACEGAGERIVGNAPDDYSSEPCEHCKPIWNLVERIQPPRVVATQPPQPGPISFEQCSNDADCCLGKDHTGDCNDIPF